MMLTEFLLARIAEEHALAEETLAAGHARYGEENYDGVQHRTAYEPDDGWLLTSPLRVLAECEAKRRIVEHAAANPMTWGSYSGDWDFAFDFVLPELAEVYSDHPDYQAEWRADTPAEGPGS